VSHRNIDIFSILTLSAYGDLMRTIRTFILRLLVDTEEPQALRGAVRSVPNDDECSFADGQSLLALLHRLKVTAVESDTSEELLPQTPTRQRRSEK